MRIRWYHFLAIVAILDAFVVFLTLEWHRRALRNAEELVATSARLGDQRGWIERAGQGILELSRPGSEVFGSKDVDQERVRVARAKAAMDGLLSATNNAGFEQADVQRIAKVIGGMNQSMGELFTAFARSQDAGLPLDERHQALEEAAQARTRVDDAHVEAMRFLGLLSARNTNEHTTLLQTYAVELGAQASRERYLIAAIIVCLTVLLSFGWWLHRSQVALDHERRRVEEARRERLAAIGEMSSGVAHGIRNPLAAIRSSAQLTLQLSRLDPDVRRRLEDIMAEAQRLGDRVTGMLNLVRLDAGCFRELSLQEVASSAAKELEPEFQRFGLVVQQELDPEDIILQGDRRQLEQVVIELLSNAMEHSKRGDCILLRCYRVSGTNQAMLSVEDQGPGVPSALQERIFELFFTTKVSGTGIGLATARRIARLHGGEIILAAASHGGARFDVMLPNADGSDASASPERREPGQKKVKG